MERHRPQQGASGKEIIFSEGLGGWRELNLSPGEEEVGKPAPELKEHSLGLL